MLTCGNTSEHHTYEKHPTYPRQPDVFYNGQVHLGFLKRNHISQNINWSPTCFNKLPVTAVTHTPVPPPWWVRWMSRVAYRIASEKSRSVRRVSLSPLVYIIKRGGGHSDGTGHRKMAVLSMAGDRGGNPCKFLNKIASLKRKLMVRLLRWNFW